MKSKYIVIIILLIVICYNLINLKKYSNLENFDNLEVINNIKVINKCAIVIPLHPKHFDYGYYIANESINRDFDLYFVFTNKEDKDLFMQKTDKHINYILLEIFTNLDIVEKTNSFVSIKKLYALSLLYDKYEYISCIDSEIKFINNNSFYEMMKNVANNKTIIGVKIQNINDFLKNITKNSLTNLIDIEYHDKLKELSNDYNIYTWWTNFPVYDCKNVNHFLTWINFNNTNLYRFNWEVFENLTYNFFCIMFYNYELKIIIDDKSFEDLNTSIVENIDSNICKMYWVSKYAYLQNPDYYNNNNYYIVNYMDRYN